MDTMAFYLGAIGCNSRFLKMTIIRKGSDMDIVAESGILESWVVSWGSVASFCCATWASA